MHRHSIYYSGRVQGVGFRYTTQRIASQFQVAGFVKNLGDGRVELVMEGAKDELGAVMDRITETMGDHIHNAVVKKSPATNEFSGFTIRH